MMPDGNNKLIPAIGLFLGFICILWIIYDIIVIYFNLPSVIYFGAAGFFVGIGYILIIIFHIFVAGIYIMHARHIPKTIARNRLLSLLIISFTGLIVQKAMFDEVGREYYIEYPFPGETYFILFGLFLNTVLLVYALHYIYKEYDIFRSEKPHHIIKAEKSISGFIRLDGQLPG